MDGVPGRIRFDRAGVEVGMSHYCMDGHLVIHSDELPPDPLWYVLESEADAEVERLRAAIREYGNHKKDCSTHGTFPHKCDCGWDKLCNPQYRRALTEGEYGRKVFNPDTGEWDDTGERSPHPVTLEDAEAEYHAEGESGPVISEAFQRRLEGDPYHFVKDENRPERG